MADPLTIGVAVNLGTLNRRLDRLRGAALDLRTFFLSVLDPEITKLLEEQFKTRGQALGTPWKALAPGTIKGRQRVIVRRGKNGRVLSKTVSTKRGRAKAGLDQPLMDQLTMWGSFVKSGGPLSIRQATALEYMRGSRDEKAPIHNRGSSKRPGRPPARPIIPARLPAPVLRAWGGLLERWLEREGLT